MIVCPTTAASECPCSPGTLIPSSPAHVVSHTSVKSPVPPAPGHHSRAPRGLPLLPSQAHGTSVSPLLHPSLPPPAIQEEDGRASGEGPGWGQEGRMPVGHPPVCPQLILAAFSVACQSGPVAPAVILRFLGHCHAGSAAKWGAGGVGGCEQGQGQGRRRSGSMTGMGVCEQRGRSVWGCVQPPSCLLGACGGGVAAPRTLVHVRACGLQRVPGSPSDSCPRPPGSRL